MEAEYLGKARERLAARLGHSIGESGAEEVLKQARKGTQDLFTILESSSLQNPQASQIPWYALSGEQVAEFVNEGTYSAMQRLADSPFTYAVAVIDAYFDREQGAVERLGEKAQELKALAIWGVLNVDKVSGVISLNEKGRTALKVIEMQLPALVANEAAKAKGAYALLSAMDAPEPRLKLDALFCAEVLQPVMKIEVLVDRLTVETFLDLCGGTIHQRAMLQVAEELALVVLTDSRSKAAAVISVTAKGRALMDSVIQRSKAPTGQPVRGGCVLALTALLVFVLLSAAFFRGVANTSPSKNSKIAGPTAAHQK